MNELTGKKGGPILLHGNLTLTASGRQPHRENRIALCANYAGAVSTSRQMPNSRLLSSDNWGHTAYALSACATAAIDAYLLTGAPPARDTVCADAPEPFSGQEQTFAERRGKHLPPVARPRSMLTVR
ncbi:alpha/beta hydrolase [Actinoplanes auranticolor]|uniref:Peptidase S33 tripeptidyl aminopeptidase-like C-terminal domain-containing protein n=1 Tax=Actinoplanes auranticolor TaxID=47988 RepID=A0A919S788_9ACTN|nr:alpha/beta hydrolase [Actinoplanes auranticolor]GIM66244.1 hypothetical protein Aau02nite_22310 [Actinoplanes auranticolor]